ncbi:hypothetical protein EMIT0P4_60071 [Pseudomonas sp. IT-P4]
MQNPSGGFEVIIPQCEPGVPCSYGAARAVIEAMNLSARESTERSRQSVNMLTNFLDEL